jgi:beta-glucosidase
VVAIPTIGRVTPPGSCWRRLAPVALVLAAVSCTGDDDGAVSATTAAGAGSGGAPTASAVPPVPTTVAPASTAPPSSAPDDVEARVESVLAQMTLADKVGQMTLVDQSVVTPADVARLGIGGVLNGGDNQPADNSAAGWRAMVTGYEEAALTTRLGIPLLYGVDAVHGNAAVAGATVFPHNVGLGAANDPELVAAIARATAIEVAATGIRWDYAPVVAVPHDVRWGRTFEGYSEDTGIVTSLGTAYLRGLQSTDGAPAFSSPADVVGTPKHFIGDGGTAWGTSTNPDFDIDQGDTQLDEATLRRRHLTPYQAAVTAGARTIMVTFSSWNGVKVHGDGYLITDVLKDELGFSGFVVSDWGGIDQIPGDRASDIVTAVNAGIDMVMVPFDTAEFMAGLTAAATSGAIAPARIDDAVRRILRVKFEAGLFDRPFTDVALLDAVGSAPHRELARRAVQGSLVLLKDDGATLPLDPATPRLLVAGVGADDIGLQSGGWTISGQGAPGPITEGTTILEGITAAVEDPARVRYAADGVFADVPPGGADVAVVVLAEQPYSEGAGDRRDLRLPAADLELLARVRPLADRLVVVLVAGRPLVVTDQIGDWDAFVAAWLPGSEGAGVADVLFGAAPFTGRLPYTWPRTNEQLPIDPEAPVAPSCTGPLFPFGYAQTEPTPAPWLTCP